MSKTIYLNSGKLNEKQFFIDVLYFSNTSFSKSLHPTFARLFRKYALRYMGGGSFTSTERTLEAPCLIDGYHAIAPYHIIRKVYTKI